jgi:hypothetical protein
MIYRHDKASFLRSALTSWLRGKTRIPISVTRGRAAFCLAFLSALSALAQGPLSPPGAPAPTMKTLSQVEPRTPISSLPFTITTSGSYYLTANLVSAAGANGITVQASGVTIDLHGFQLAGVAGSLNGVTVSSAQSGLTIFGGAVTGWGGVGVNAGNASGSQFNHLILSQNASHGLIAGTNGIVRDCVATANSGDGLELTSSGFAENNNCQSNALCGLHVLGNSCRVEANHLGANGTSGLQADGTQNLIVKNSAINNGINYNIAANNDYGQILASPGLGFTNFNPWANFASVPAPLAGGSACTANSQCASGSCLGGYCCGSVCSSGGACGVTACDTSGNCVYPNSSTVCAGASCSGASTLTSTSYCNGTGSCVTGSTVNCSPYTCSGTACLTTCTSSAQCVSGYTCSSGSCVVALLGAGSACTSSSQCVSGNCFGGYCCTGACSTSGVCGAVACNTSGACVYASMATVCAGASCSGSTLTTTSYCNGAGTCNPGSPATISCAPYVCGSSTACATSCSSDAQCVSTSYCINPGASGTCVAKKGSGLACSANDQCLSGTCSGGLCM